MKLDIYHIDAFADQVFQGNPAAVCILDSWLADGIMQAIAAELNLSETAFVVKRHDGDFRIRWFTPTTEVNLCGHATLASAFVLYTVLHHPMQPIRFHSLSGPLICSQDEFGIRLDFPSQIATPIESHHSIENALRLNTYPEHVYASEDLIVMLDDASEVAVLEPDFNALKQLPYRGVCVTAPGNGNGFDFVCRFFAPQSGINEDPVTGSVYTSLAPLYALKLGRSVFSARQVSARGGNLHVELHGDRVNISGKAVFVMHSQFNLPNY